MIGSDKNQAKMPNYIQLCFKKGLLKKFLQSFRENPYHYYIDRNNFVTLV